MAWEKEWKNKPIKADMDLEEFKKQYEQTPIKMLEEAAPITKEAWNNLKPTHDPHTNPNAFLYYECQCGERLDPHTKSFAGLNNTASLAGWKIRWGSDSYVPYCPKCGEGVE